MPETCATEPRFTSPIVTNQSYMAYVPAVLLAAGIAVVSLMENPHVPDSVRLGDKMLHGLMYALLGICAMWGALFNGHDRWPVYVAVAVAVTVYGGVMEWLQYACTETRSGEWLDVAADLAGGITGIAVAGLSYWLWKKRTHTTLH